MKTATSWADPDEVRPWNRSGSTPLDPRMTGASLDGTTLLAIILWRGPSPLACKNHDEISRTDVSKNTFRRK
jgi:hypothetical protein